MGIGGEMKERRIKWQVLFVVMCILVSFSIYDAFTIDESIAPTHPLLVSILLLCADVLILIGAYSYAFRKELINSKAFWIFTITFYVFIYIVALGYEFINNRDGYEIYDMFQISIIYLLFAVCVLTPTVRYISDLTLRKK
tara:strand:- start:1204 stop:1623 length:420 start_codon:yes stop_codon:yes gene_type:complete